MNISKLAHQVFFFDTVTAEAPLNDIFMTQNFSNSPFEVIFRVGLDSFPPFQMQSGILAGNWVTKLFNTKCNMSTTQGTMQFNTGDPKDRTSCMVAGCFFPQVPPGTSGSICLLGNWLASLPEVWRESFSSRNSVHVQIRTSAEAQKIPNSSEWEGFDSEPVTEVRTCPRSVWGFLKYSWRFTGPLFKATARIKSKQHCRQRWAEVSAEAVTKWSERCHDLEHQVH